jgi:hypothetical protein
MINNNKNKEVVEIRTCSTCFKALPTTMFKAHGDRIKSKVLGKKCLVCLNQGLETSRLVANRIRAILPLANTQGLDTIEIFNKLDFIIEEDINCEGFVRVFLPPRWTSCLCSFSGKKIIHDAGKQQRLKYDAFSEDGKVTFTNAITVVVDYAGHIKGCENNDRKGGVGELVGVVKFGNTVVFLVSYNQAASLSILRGDSPNNHQSILNILRILCDNYVEQHYPSHNNPLAYWAI